MTQEIHEGLRHSKTSEETVESQSRSVGLPLAPRDSFFFLHPPVGESEVLLGLAAFGADDGLSRIDDLPFLLLLLLPCTRPIKFWGRCPDGLRDLFHWQPGSLSDG